MVLIERAEFLSLLKTKFEKIEKGEGHCIFVSGEAGIGKTSLVKTFCKEQKGNCNIYLGACDALFTPRPLAPLFDIMWQVSPKFSPGNKPIDERAELFSVFFNELRNKKENNLIIFEDIHWADEATLDFIKFLARRITQLRCLFILTFRDDSTHSRHPLINLLGQLNADTFTRIPLLPLSRHAVEKMANDKGFKGEDVYSISGGNPFYVNEILASYSQGIPANIKDSILTVYNRQDAKTKYVWEILSVLPTGIEIKYLEKIEPEYLDAVQNSLESGILILKERLIYFKHEMYRRTIETSISALLRIALNKKILHVCRDNFERTQEIERIVHHAKNANENELVMHYAPIAAGKAASLGAHLEASKLYHSAIEYYQGNDKDKLVQFYEAYSYECYLTNQIKEAIIYQGKTLKILKEKGDAEKTGNCMRFLSRLWWFEGNRKKAESYGMQAIDLLEKQPLSKVKAMTLSNMSQLKMLSGEFDECLFWGNKAISMANALGDQEVLSHAYNNVGTVQMGRHSSWQKGMDLMLQSLDIALKNGYHEHAARAYSNLGSTAVEMKEYDTATKYLADSLQYCEERHLDSWTTYSHSYRARLNLETGNWNEAYLIADNLVKNGDQQPVIKIIALFVLGTIKMRRGDNDAHTFLLEAKSIGFETMEPQRLIPVVIALLEYEWITGTSLIEKEELECAKALVGNRSNIFRASEFAFWLLKVKNQSIPLLELFEGYQVNVPELAARKSSLWEQLGCPYEQALALFEGDEANKRKAINIVHQLEASAVFEKMKRQMRASGIKKIPRGMQKATRSNSALLTGRQLDVLHLLKDGMLNKEIAAKLFLSTKTVDHHISAILYKLEVNSRNKAVHQAIHQGIIK